MTGACPLHRGRHAGVFALHIAEAARGQGDDDYSDDDDSDDDDDDDDDVPCSSRLPL